MNEMELITRQEPGLVEFYNFEDLKSVLEMELLPEIEELSTEK